MATREDSEGIPAEWLIAAMDARGIGQAALSRRLDIDDTTIYRWRKSASITRLNWLAVLRALDLPTSWKPGDDVPPLDA